MAFAVAKESEYAPVILYLDDCHEFFMGKSKRGGSTANAEMQRFQKDLLIYKNQSLRKEDRVLVIGCTNAPETGDAKLLRWKGPTGKPEKQGFFERSLYFPRANQADRAMMWKEAIKRKLSEFNQQATLPELLDYAALSFVSDGLSAREITSAVDSVLSKDRVEKLACRPLTECELSSSFSAGPQDDQRFLIFTRQITNLDAAWKNINVGDKKPDKKK